MQDQLIVPFNKIDKNDIEIVGGKGSNLGELTKIGISVPNGFIVTADAYYETIKMTGALDRLRGILYDLDVDNPLDLQIKAKKCREEILQIKFPDELKKKIFIAYKNINANNNAFVAVRSSATAEDLPQASFAGQQSTFLNVKGNDKLILAIRNVWASLFEARSISYRVFNKFNHFKVKIAVPIQKMVQSDTSGVMFTLDPITNNKKNIIIEAIYGLGELIVSGAENPDHYVVDKKHLKIIDKEIKNQNNQLIYTKQGNKNRKISKTHSNEQKITDQHIIELATLGKKIEKHYYFPQDIEWAIENDKIYIVQTRPVTTVKDKQHEKLLKQNILDDKDFLLQGSPAAPSIGTGTVNIIHSAKEISLIKPGDVLVTEMTNPDFVPAMKKASAIVTDRGGRTSHAAIVSRELGIACVVGTENATKKLKKGMLITVDGSKGTIYKGQLIKSSKDIPYKKLDPKTKEHKTATKLFVNLAEPELAHSVAVKNIDGIGLLRAEFILAQIGIHPKLVIHNKKQENFINTLSNKLNIFAKAFSNKPVIYRATDFKSNEYKNLKGGDKYEPHEDNPMMGYRGAYRYIKNPDVFKLELEAISRVRRKHDNLHLMIPFVRNVTELKTIKNIVLNYGLFEDNSFEFFMMVELPSNVISLEKFIEVGIDGISIGSNDLTMLILGADRDNKDVSSQFNEMDPSVLWAIKKTIQTAAKHKIKSSICGQAPSVYPELTKMLVNWGITSISVSPDTIETTRQNIYDAELKNIIN